MVNSVRSAGETAPYQVTALGVEPSDAAAVWRQPGGIAGTQFPNAQQTQ